MPPPSAAPEKANIRNRKRAARLRAAGLCPGCGKSRDGAALTCRRCTAVIATAALRLRAARRNIGLCRCGRTVERWPDKASCDRCLERKRAWQRRWKARQAAATGKAAPPPASPALRV